MFERRLKIFLGILCAMVLLMIARAAQVQLIEADNWRDAAAHLMRRYVPVETSRGGIRDRRGNTLAEDEPCIDACVDYRAVEDPPDDKWVHAQAESRVRSRLETIGDGNLHPRGRAGMITDEEKLVRADIDRMWADLVAVSGKTPDQIDEIRHAIVSRVEMRRRYLWWKNFQKNGSKPTDPKVDKEWYRRFLSDQAPDTSNVDEFSLDVAEQTEPHVVLRAIDPDTQSKLAARSDHHPGLVLQPSRHRVYPYGRAACHILGRLGQVGPEDFGKNDPFADDDLRRYWPNDQIGRAGAESLFEHALRGSRGQLELDGGASEPISTVDPVPGKDIRLSIDIELQSEIEQAFVKRRSFPMRDEPDEVREDQHGAAVVIDVASGEVLAMVSNPGFDPNQLDVEYAKLSRDELNKPMLNRATQMALEPGSTVKTIVGSGSITDGVMTPETRIECTGYLVLDGHRYSVGRCWVAAQFEKTLGVLGVAHHKIPYQDPHPTGFLTITEALERSCNVVFETIADRMGMHALVYWFDRFGLGRPTGIGIEESRGLVPDGIDTAKNSPRRMWTWFAGIGQGMVHATPIQMANVAATLARGGMWVRPKLYTGAEAAASMPAADPTNPDRVDLHLTPEAVDAVHRGMIAVTQEIGGTGRGIRADEQLQIDPNDPLARIVIAGKTGSAQAAMLTVPVRDEKGALLKDANGRYRHEVIPLGAPGTEGWYVGVGTEQHLAHAWYIGFAPANHPQVAFCVMVEYGGAGGRVAGSIAHDVLEACVRHGYLSVPGAGN